MALADTLVTYTTAVVNRSDESTINEAVAALLADLLQISTSAPAATAAAAAPAVADPVVTPVAGA